MTQRPSKGRGTQSPFLSRAALLRSIDAGDFIAKSAVDWDRFQTSERSISSRRSCSDLSRARRTSRGAMLCTACPCQRLTAGARLDWVPILVESSDGLTNHQDRESAYGAKT